MPAAKNRLRIKINSCFSTDNDFTPPPLHPPDTHTDQSGSGNLVAGNSLDGCCALPTAPAWDKDRAPAGITGQNRMSGAKKPLRCRCPEEGSGQRVQGLSRQGGVSPAETG